MQVLKFPAFNTYEEHWKHLDKFISGDIKQKKKLGFMLHDINGDGKICPNDVFDLTSNLKQTQTLISSDIFHIVNSLQRKQIIENKPPGYILKGLNEEFKLKWNERNRSQKLSGSNSPTNSHRRGSSCDSQNSKVRF